MNGVKEAGVKEFDNDVSITDTRLRPDMSEKCPWL